MKVEKCVTCLGSNSKVPINCEEKGGLPCFAILPKYVETKEAFAKLTKKYNYFIPIKAKELNSQYIKVMQDAYRDCKGELYVKS